MDVIVQFHGAPSQADFDKVRGKGGKLKKGLSAVKGGLFLRTRRSPQRTREEPEDSFYLAGPRGSGHYGVRGARRWC